MQFTLDTEASGWPIARPGSSSLTLDPTREDPRPVLPFPQAEDKLTLPQVGWIQEGCSFERRRLRVPRGLAGSRPWAGLGCPAEP